MKTNEHNNVINTIINNDQTKRAIAHEFTVLRVVFGCDATGNNHIGTEYKTTKLAEYCKNVDMRQGSYDEVVVRDVDCTVHILTDRHYGLKIYYVYLDPSTPEHNTPLTEDNTQYADTHCTISSYVDGKDTPVDVYVSPTNMQDKIREMDKIFGAGMGEAQHDGSVVYRLYAAKRTVVVTRGKVA